MAAIITDKLKKLVVQQIFDDAGDSNNNYYIAIGRSEDWDSADAAPTPVNTERQVYQTRLSLQSAKAVADFSFVIPRYNWTSGSIYSQFNDNVTGHPVNSYYVLTDENQVYVCIQQGRDANGSAVASTVKPTGGTTSPFLVATADGYIWRFVFTLGAIEATKYLTSNYMPVKLQGTTDSDSPAVDIQQETVQNNAVQGQILGYRVVAAGTGYTSDPTVLVVGDGSGARARAVVGSSGTIVNAQRVDDSAGTLGQNYNYANVTITGGGGTGAKIVPVYGPKAGLGADPRDDLRSDAIMFNIKPDGIETGDFLIGNDFRQIVLLKNPLIADSDALFTGNTGRILKAINFATVTNAFTEDRIIQGSISGAKGVVDYFDDSATLWYHQTEDTGFIPFTDSDNITETTGSGAGSVGTLLPAEVDAFSGDILYIDNRAAVSRSVDQTEDIKVVIQL